MARARAAAALRRRGRPARLRRARHARACPPRPCCAARGVLARRAVAVVRRRGAAPRDLATAVALLADAVDELVRHLDDPAAETASRRIALDAARRATAVLAEDHGLHTSALVAQVRSTAVDLLRGSGLTEDEATTALDDALAVSPRE